MTDWLVGGAVGTLLGALGMGLLLWRERSKRADADEARLAAESELLSVHVELDRTKALANTLRTIATRKEARIHDLEAQLAQVDPGRLLDDVFAGVSPDPKADPAPK